MLDCLRDAVHRLYHPCPRDLLDVHRAAINKAGQRFRLAGGNAFDVLMDVDPVGVGGKRVFDVYKVYRNGVEVHRKGMLKMGVGSGVVVKGLCGGVGVSVTVERVCVSDDEEQPATAYEVTSALFGHVYILPLEQNRDAAAPIIPSNPPPPNFCEDLDGHDFYTARTLLQLLLRAPGILRNKPAKWNLKQTFESLDWPTRQLTCPWMEQDTDLHLKEPEGGGLISAVAFRIYDSNGVVHVPPVDGTGDYTIVLAYYADGELSVGSVQGSRVVVRDWDVGEWCCGVPEVPWVLLPLPGGGGVGGVERVVEMGEQVKRMRRSSPLEELEEVEKEEFFELFSEQWGGGLVTGPRRLVITRDTASWRPKDVPFLVARTLATLCTFSLEDLSVTDTLILHASILAHPHRIAITYNLPLNPPPTPLHRSYTQNMLLAGRGVYPQSSCSLEEFAFAHILFDDPSSLTPEQVICSLCLQGENRYKLKSSSGS